MDIIIPAGKSNTKLPVIVRAAIHLFVEKGIEGTTIAQIAKKARVAEGALYRHFKGKDELAWYIFATNLNQFTTDLMSKVLSEKGLEKRIHRFVSECFLAFDSDRDLFTFLILTEHRELRKYPTTASHPGHIALKVIEDAQRDGEIAPAEAYLLVALFIGALIRACVVHNYGRISGSLKDQSGQVSSALVGMLKSFRGS